MTGPTGAEGSHPAPHEYTYKVFLSYASSPDYYLARDTEVYLESFNHLRAVKNLGLPKIEVCRDGSDFKLPSSRSDRGSEVDRILDSYLQQSEYLVVLCSRGAVHSTYVNYEIDWFVTHGREDKILLLVTEGNQPLVQPEEVFPAKIIKAGLHQRLWYDLRGKRRLRNRSSRKVRDFDEELVKLAAHLYGESASNIYPVWQRRQEQRSKWLRLAVAAVVACLCVALAVWMWMRSNPYQRSLLLKASLADEIRNPGGGAERWSELLIDIQQPDRAIEFAKSLQPRESRQALCAAGEALLEIKDRRRAGIAFRAASVGGTSDDPLVNEECLAGVIATLGRSDPQVEALIPKPSRRGGYLAKRLAELGETQAALEMARAAADWSTLTELSAQLPPKERRAILDEVMSRGSPLPRGVVQGYSDLGDDLRTFKLAEEDDSDIVDSDAARELRHWAVEHKDLGRLRLIVSSDPIQLTSVVKELLVANSPDLALSILEGVEATDEQLEGAILLVSAALMKDSRCADALRINERNVALCLKSGCSQIKAVADVVRDCAAPGAASSLLDQWRRTEGLRAQRAIAAGELEVAQYMAEAAVDQDEVETAIAIGEQIPWPDTTENHSRDLATKIGHWFAARGDERAFSIGRVGVADCSTLASDFAAIGRVHAASRAIECGEAGYPDGYLLAHAILVMAQGAHYDEILQLARMQEERSKAPGPAVAMVLSMAAAGRSDELLEWLGYLNGESALLALSGAAALLNPSSPLKRNLGERALAIKAPGERRGSEVSVWYHAGVRLLIANQPDLVLEASNRTVDERETSELRAMAAWYYARHGSMRLASNTIDLIPMKSWQLSARESALRYGYGLSPNDNLVLSSINSEKRAMGQPYLDQR
jgi:hypothetical protein